MKFMLGDHVIYEGNTYTFPGEVCAVTDDGQFVVRAFGCVNGDYKGMKHIYGGGQLNPYTRPLKMKQYASGTSP